MKCETSFVLKSINRQDNRQPSDPDEHLWIAVAGSPGGHGAWSYSPWSTFLRPGLGSSKCKMLTVFGKFNQDFLITVIAVVKNQCTYWYLIDFHKLINAKIAFYMHYKIIMNLVGKTQNFLT